jgi:signal peptidase II
MKKWKSMALVLFTIITCVGCDQVTKVIARSSLPRNSVLSFAGDTLRLDYNENKGAVFSFEPLLPESLHGSAVTVAVTVFLGLLILYLLFASGLKPLAAMALSLFCGGALSNLLDRIAFGGYVVDFLNIGWGGFRSGIFNVADAAITIGMLLLIFSVAWNLLHRLRSEQYRDYRQR